MTIVENLDRLVAAKENIAEAITNKGVEVGEGEGFESFAEKIDGIPTGGAPDWFGDGEYLVKNNLSHQIISSNIVIYNNEIHLLSAYHSTSDRNYTGHYKWNGSSWIRVSTLPYTYSTHGMAIVYNNEIHLLGCNYNDGTPTQHYKWNGSSWISVSTLPYYFSFGAAVVMDGELHILGSGYYTSGSYPYAKEHYKWNGSSWIKVSTLPYNFSGGTGFVYNDEIHIVGSNTNPGGSSVHCKFKENKWTSDVAAPIKIAERLNKIMINGNPCFMAYGNNPAIEWDGAKWNQHDNILLDKTSAYYIQYNDYLVGFTSSNWGNMTYGWPWYIKKIDWK